MKKLVVILISVSSLFTINQSYGQAKVFVKDIEYALALEDTASSYGSVVKAAQNLEQLTKKYPNEWLAFYWTAHVYSQCAVFSRNSSEKSKYSEYLDTAQAFFDQGWQIHKNKDKIDESDFYALQSNMHGLRIGQYRYQQDWENVRKYAKLQEEALQKAEQTNADNPMAWMLKGLDLLRAQETRDEGQRVLAVAIEKYKKFPPKSKIHPRWGRQWIDFWLKRYEGSN